MHSRLATQPCLALLVVAAVLSGCGSATKSAVPASALPQVVLHTSTGDIRCELWPDRAPKTVKNFLGLAQGTQSWVDPTTGEARTEPLYNSTIFHRVLPEMMIQGGDPLGTGLGGPGYRFEDEIAPDVTFDRPGRLAMANAGPNTNGSQFFITVDAPRQLDGMHTIFGQCEDEVARRIAQGERTTHPQTGEQSWPVQPTILQWIEVHPATETSGG